MIGVLKKNSIATAFVLLIISLSIAFFTRNFLFGIGNIYEKKEQVSLRIHVKDEKDPKSYGRLMIITDIDVGGEKIDLRKLASDQWIWYEQYNYLAYEGENEDIYINVNHSIDDLNVTFAHMNAGGIVEFYINDAYSCSKNLFYENENWRIERLTFSFCDKRELLSIFLINSVTIWGILLIAFLALIRFLENKTYKSPKIGIGFFNQAKGIAIFAVILQHNFSTVFVGIENYKFKSIFSFGLLWITYGFMPMLFIISGYGFRVQNIRKCIKQQLNFFMKPYIVLAISIVVFTLLYYVLYLDGGIEAFLYYVLPFVLVSFVNMRIGDMPIRTIGPVWFCVALCIGWIMLDAILLVKNKWLKRGLIVLCIPLSYFFSKTNYNILCLGQSFMTVPFLYVGYLMKKTKFLKKESPGWALIMTVLNILLCIIAFANGAIPSHGFMDLGNSYVLGILLSIFFGYSCIWIYIHIMDIGIIKKIKYNVFSRLGTDTFDILFVHTFWITLTPWINIMELISSSVFVKFMFILLIQWIQIIVSLFIIKGIKRLYVSCNNNGII